MKSYFQRLVRVTHPDGRAWHCRVRVQYRDEDQGGLSQTHAVYRVSRTTWHATPAGAIAAPLGKPEAEGYLIPRGLAWDGRAAVDLVAWEATSLEREALRAHGFTRGSVKAPGSKHWRQAPGQEG